MTSKTNEIPQYHVSSSHSISLDKIQKHNQAKPRAGRITIKSKIDPKSFDTISCASELFFPNSELLKDFDIGILHEIDIVLQARSTAKKEIDVINQNIVSVNAEIARAKEDISSIQEAIRSNSSGLNELSDPAIQIQVRDNSQSVQASIQTLEIAIEKLTNDIASLQDQKGRLESQITQNEKKLGKILKRIHISTTEPENAENMKKKRKMLIADMKNLKMEIKSDNRKLINLNQNLELKEGILERKEETLRRERIRQEETLRRERIRKEDKLVASIRDLEASIKDLEANKRSLVAEIKGLNADIINYEATIIEKAKKFEETILVDAGIFIWHFNADFLIVQDEYYIRQIQKHLDVLRNMKHKVLKKQLFTNGVTTDLPYLCENHVDSRFALNEDCCSVRFSGRQMLRNFFHDVFKNMKLKYAKPPFKVKVPLMLYGTIGCGKSYMMLALVSYLMSRGERVIYFAFADSMLEPSCWGEKLFFLIEQEKRREDPDIDFIDYIKNILNKSRKSPISEFLDELIRLSEHVYLFVDQFDTLFPTDEHKTRIERLVDSYGQGAVLASSANDRMANDRVRGKFKRVYFDVFKGYTEEEFELWKKRNQTLLDNINVNDKQLDLLAKGTGLVPLYLEDFLKAEGSEFDSKYHNFESALADEIKESLDIFYAENVDLDEISTLKKENYINAAFRCIRHEPTSRTLIKYIHNRYYTVGLKEGISGSCCGIAERVLEVKFKDLFNLFAYSKADLLRQLSRVSNGSDAGHVAERIGIMEVFEGFELPAVEYHVEVVETLVPKGSKKKVKVVKTSYISKRVTKSYTRSKKNDSTKKVTESIPVPMGVVESSGIPMGDVENPGTGKKNIKAKQGGADISEIKEERKEIIQPVSTSLVNWKYFSPERQAAWHCYQVLSNHSTIDCLLVKDKTFYGINFTINSGHIDTLPKFINDFCALSLSFKVKDIRFIWWGSKEAIAGLKKGILRKWTARKYFFPGKTIRLYFKEFGEDVEEVLKNRTGISEMVRRDEEWLNHLRMLRSKEIPKRETHNPKNSTSSQLDLQDSAIKAHDGDVLDLSQQETMAVSSPEEAPGKSSSKSKIGIKRRKPDVPTDQSKKQRTSPTKMTEKNNQGK